MRPGTLAVGLCLTIVLSLPACGRSRSSAAATGYPSRASQGDVSFELTPRGMVDGRFVVDLRADTHGGDLSEVDLARAATLRAAGKSYKPLEADSLRGHHSGGSMAFALGAAPDSFEIVLDGIRSLGEVRFRWP